MNAPEPRRLTTQRRQTTRSEIIATAEKVFLRRGLRNTMLSEIAEEVGLGRAALYYYFKSREELVSATIEAATRRFHLFEEAATDQTFADQVSTAVQHLISAVSSSNADVLFLMSALIEQLNDPPDQQLMRTEVTNFRASTQAALERGKRRGEVAWCIDSKDESNRLLADLIGRELLVVLDADLDFESAALRVLEDFLARVSPS